MENNIKMASATLDFSSEAAKKEEQCSPVPNNLRALFGQDRLLAISSGTLRQSLTAEIVKILGENRNNLLSTLKRGIETLLEEGLISKTDVSRLNLVTETVINYERNKLSQQEAFKTIDSTYREMVLDKGTSDLAIAIVSNVNYLNPNSITIPENTVALAVGVRVPDGVANGAIGGGLLGGIVGGIITGTATGGVLGGVIGGIVGGVVGAICD